MALSIRLLLGVGVGASLASASEFPLPYKSGSHTVPPSLTVEAARAALRLSPGFKASVFAGEPDVQNPISMAWDARGRLWIAENYTYAERTLRFEAKLRDRVVIFEDRDG